MSPYVTISSSKSKMDVGSPYACWRAAAFGVGGWLAAAAFMAAIGCVKRLTFAKGSVMGMRGRRPLSFALAGAAMGVAAGVADASDGSGMAGCWLGGGEGGRRR